MFRIFEGRGPNRRDFLESAGLGVAGLVLPQLFGAEVPQLELSNVGPDKIPRKPFGRMILGEPIVFFRKEDSTPVALEDRCVHRHLPLSMGKLVGDHLQCHYHGLRYDCTGQCVKVPGQNTVPPSAAASKPSRA